MTSSDLTTELQRLHREAFGWALTCAQGDREGAEEVLQTTYLRVLSQKARFGGRSSFKTWLFGVIRQVAREQRRREVWRSLFFESNGERIEEAPAGPTKEPADTAFAEHLRVLVNGLPRRQAEVLMLAFYHDLSLSEVASALGISLGTVRRHYARGKTRLRTLMRKDPATSEFRQNPPQTPSPECHARPITKISI